VTVGRVKRMVRYNTATWKCFGGRSCIFLLLLRNSSVVGLEVQSLGLNIHKFLNFSCSQEFGAKSTREKFCAHFEICGAI
jgi:hypothetical protein